MEPTVQPAANPPADDWCPDLESVCDCCDGVGEFYGAAGSGDCDKCGGSGYLMTPFAEKILQLMQHNFRPFLREAVRDQ